MTRIRFEQPDGSTCEVDATDGASLMQTAVGHGIEGIVAECGGSAMCATCHVYVDPTQLALLPAPDAVENEMLDSTADTREANSRLSCQVRIRPELDGLRVRVPRRQT
jgi:ferredoxin, 2Fe-2S